MSRRQGSVDPETITLEERRRHLRRLIGIRIVAVTTLLVPAMWLQLRVGSEVSLTALFTLIAVVYGVSALFGLAYRRFADWPPFGAVQLVVDVVVVTLLVYLLGGLRSPAVLLYLVVAFGAGVITSRQTALGIACLSGVSYGLMAHLIQAGWIPQWDFEFAGAPATYALPELYARVFSVLLSSCLVAWVASVSTERLRRARHQLRQERSAHEALQKLNQQLLSGMSSGLIAADRSGRVIACNRAAETILARPEAELVDRDVAEIFDFTEETLAELRAVDAEPEVQRLEKRLQLPDGRHRIVGMSVTRVLAANRDDGEGRADGRSAGREGERSQPWHLRGEGPIAGGAIFMFQDLTDIKRMERLFWMRERMAYLGEMAGSLAHEIRNPLASISGSLQVLRRNQEELEHPRSNELMEIVTRESQRLSRIIDEFLDYARPEKLEAERTDLVVLVRETFTLLENSPELGAGCELRIEAESDTVEALVDPAKIKQVFWNLARNAVQAMPEGGTLRVGLQRRPAGAEVVFEDDGQGMEPAQVEQIFRPFVSRSDAGTGLGLAIVYRILEQHGARAEVESSPGQGTRFLLLFHDARVPQDEEDDLVVVEGGEEQRRLFGELSRSVSGPPEAP